MKANHKYSFPTSGRENNKIKISPGPGEYNLPPKFNDIPKYLL